MVLAALTPEVAVSIPINPYESPADPISTAVDDEVQRQGKFKPVHLWGSAAIVALTINVALAIAALWFDGRLFAAYSGFAVADNMDAEWVDGQLNRVNTVSILMVCFRWLTAACVITWMYQCHRNLTALGHGELDSKPIWVVLCWFVPLMNFFCPYQVMQEIWRRSDPDAIDAEPDPGTPLVTSWWLTWLAMIAAGTFANHIAKRQEAAWDHSDMIWWSGAEIFRSSLTIVSALLLIAIIVKLNRRQAQRSVTLTIQNSDSSPPQPL